MKDRLITNGVRNMHQFGYDDANSTNILTDEVYSKFFLSMLKDNLGQGADDPINALIAEIEES